MKPFALVVTALLLIASLSGIVRGDMLYPLYTPPSTYPLTSFSGYTVGTEFTVAAGGIKVTDLGFWDGPSASEDPEVGDGLETAHDIGIWQVDTSTNTGTLLTAATVLAGTVDPLVDGFRYVTLATPLPLVNGDTYRIGGYLTSTADPYQNEETVTFSSPFTTSAAYDVVRYAAGDLTDPSSTDTSLTGTAVAGPNFLFETPEPASLSLLAVGGVLLLRRKARFAL